MWNDCVAEQVEDQFDDWPEDLQPRSFLFLTERMSNDGQAPIAWVESYLARKRYSDQDRAQLELRALVRIIEQGMMFHQLNCSALASFELVARRFQQILGAHAINPQQPSYETADLYGGLGDEEEAIAPALRRMVNSRLKERNQTIEAAVKSRGLKTKPPMHPKQVGQ